MTDVVPTEQEIKGAIDFRCPCGAKCTAGYVATNLHPETPVVLHEQPMCEPFKQKDPIEFLAYVNERARG